MSSLSETEVRTLLTQLPVLSDDSRLRQELKGRYGNVPGGYESLLEGQSLEQAITSAMQVNGGTKIEATPSADHVQFRYRNFAIDEGVAVWKVSGESYCLFSWEIQLD